MNSPIPSDAELYEERLVRAAMDFDVPSVEALSWPDFHRVIDARKEFSDLFLRLAVKLATGVPPQA